MMESMYKLAKYRYECGNYSQTTSYLYFYLLVMPPTDKVIMRNEFFLLKRKSISISHSFFMLC